MDALLEVFFLPPMAIARVGSADTALEAYQWEDGRSAHGGNQTVIRPTPTFEVLDDGSLRAYLPDAIQFKDDDGRIRPVAPFLELWGEFQSSTTGETYASPLTTAKLAALGISRAHLRIQITATNQKAARRAQTPACSFTARVAFTGDNHQAHDLWASSRFTPGQVPLVLPEHPIHLGRIQAIRPTDVVTTVAGQQLDLSVVRLRFTPPRGKVYGPPSAERGPASPVPPGQWDAPQTDYGNLHTIVDPENRILNEGTVYSTQYAWGTTFEDPQPQDGYDGADVGTFRAWGTVDDAGDAVIELDLMWRGQRFQAMARIFTGPPDFAPDRRPFFSIADDLADRDLAPPVVTTGTEEETIAEIVDLLQRVFETVSQFNLDAARYRGLLENTMLSGPLPSPPVPPAVDGHSMTASDTPYVDKAPTLVAPQPPTIASNSVANDQLPYTAAAHFVHAEMMEETVLVDFLKRRPDHIRRLIRPPIGSFSQLPSHPSATPNPAFRDPRVPRDMLHDMRMPPYMRDANYAPLALTRRQYHTLMALLDHLEAQQAGRRS